MKQMKLEIKNFGPIKEAEIDIGKITVIAGPNASGKTTSSKLLYCFLASVSSDGEYLANKGISERLMRFLPRLGLIIDDDYPDKSEELGKLYTLVSDFPLDISPKMPVEKVYDGIVKILDEVEFDNKPDYEKSLNEIKKLLEIKDDREMFNAIINTLLRIEFGGADQIANYIEDSIIEFSGQFNDCKFSNCIVTDGLHSKEGMSKNYLNCIHIDEVSYIETPYIFDFLVAVDYDLPSRQSNYHQKLLMRKLRDTSSEEDVFDKFDHTNIINFQKRIDKIINGKFKFDSKKKDFNFEQNDKSYSIKNIAAGLKQFGIIQLLLENRKLPEDSYLIMDEPEVHLHPEWQLKLAEILVLLSKELNVTVYINTHSPQFIEAIDVYSKYYNISKGTNFYLTNESENAKFNFKKIERKNLNQIYDCLGNPYDLLDKIIGKTDARDVIEGRD